MKNASPLLDVESLLGSEGPLSRAFPHYEMRDEQKNMLLDVLEAFETNGVALVEAGTGTGKSLAYLIPSLLWALKKQQTVVISTHTIALQEQLLRKDIPTLLGALNIDAKSVLVKGMSNYLCRRKIQDSVVESHFFSGKEKEVFEQFDEWSENAVEGSRSELPFPCSNEIWEKVNAEADSCSHSKCPFFKSCFFFKARQELENAQILIVNHSLLFADLVVRKDTNNFDRFCILPPYSRLIMDEAHHIEEIATEYFAKKVRPSFCIRYLGKLLPEKGPGKLRLLHHKILECYPGPERPKHVQQVLDQIDLFLPAQKRDVLHKLEETFRHIDDVFNQWGKEEKLRLRAHHLTHPLWTDLIQPVVNTFCDELNRFIQSVLGLESHLTGESTLKNAIESSWIDIQSLCQRLQQQSEGLKDIVFEEDNREQVRWIERQAGQLGLVMANLSVSSFLEEHLFNRLSTVVLCSATLAAQKSFSFIRSRLGITDCKEKIYPSPFKYDKQVLLSIPTDMPDPDDKRFISSAVKAMGQLIEKSRGNAFVLFTSYQMLKQCAEEIAPFLEENRYPFFMQGVEGRSVLIEKFKTTNRSVLFGTDSFWEGVDVAGDALRCVIIVKLPFKVPSDPLFSARSEKIQEEGGSPFFDYSLPHAIMKFKQGFGRLIRTREDRGCVVCLDSRILKKGYGKCFLKSLPTCQESFDSLENVLGKMQAFYKEK